METVILRFKPYLEVFSLSKLLVPGVQIQIQMYLNSHKTWSRHMEELDTFETLPLTIYLKVTFFVSKESRTFSVQKSNESAYRL